MHLTKKQHDAGNLKKGWTNLNITNYKVYDMPDAIVASGLPMMTKFHPLDFEIEVAKTDEAIRENGSNKHIERAIRLANAPDGSGHKTFLSGILVAVNITATMKWWVQFGRYHFQQIDSSMSTMHKLKDMVINNTVNFHPSTNPQVIAEFIDLVHKTDDIEEIAYSVPSGLELTARVNTNYLQLRTILVQRINHALDEWHDFCGWVLNLPMADKLIAGGLKNGGTAS